MVEDVAANTATATAIITMAAAADNGKQAAIGLLLEVISGGNADNQPYYLNE